MNKKIARDFLECPPLGCKLYDMTEMEYAWIEKHKRVVGSALHLDEQPVILSTTDMIMDANFMIWMEWCMHE